MMFISVWWFPPFATSVPSSADRG